MSDGSKVYRCVFKPLSQEETAQRLQARKIEEMSRQTRDKLDVRDTQPAEPVASGVNETTSILNVKLPVSNSGNGGL